MAKYRIDYAIYGSIIIEANDEENAREIYTDMSYGEIIGKTSRQYEHLTDEIEWCQEVEG